MSIYHSLIILFKSGLFYHWLFFVNNFSDACYILIFSSKLDVSKSIGLLLADEMVQPITVLSNQDHFHLSHGRLMQGKVMFTIVLTCIPPAFIRPCDSRNE